MLRRIRLQGRNQAVRAVTRHDADEPRDTPIYCQFQPLATVSPVMAHSWLYLNPIRAQGGGHSRAIKDQPANNSWAICRARFPSTSPLWERMMDPRTLPMPLGPSAPVSAMAASTHPRVVAASARLGR